jgi:hypothetical protein
VRPYTRFVETEQATVEETTRILAAARRDLQELAAKIEQLR